MDIIDWFDPENLDHLRAYKHLENFGTWPKGFLPEGIEIPCLWSALLVNKIADFFIDEMLK